MSRHNCRYFTKRPDLVSYNEFDNITLTAFSFTFLCFILTSFFSRINLFCPILLFYLSSSHIHEIHLDSSSLFLFMHWSVPSFSSFLSSWLFLPFFLLIRCHQSALSPLMVTFNILNLNLSKFLLSQSNLFEKTLHHHT